MDIMGGVFLADGTEVKLVSGIDDHSRYCVVAQLVARATGRAVCSAFAASLARHGVPGEILTDNGKQFTGRFTRPRPAEVLFERICRENGIATRLTRPRTHHDREDRSVAQDPPGGVPRHSRRLRQPGARTVRAGCLGGLLQR